jgi:cyclopropane fatty-acyl-phospholipid synthase-like methyltransferase
MKIKSLPQHYALYRILTDSDHLHFGYWKEAVDSEMSLLQAQQALSQQILRLFSKAPQRILIIGCPLGAMASVFAQSQSHVVALVSSESLMRYAVQYHPGPEYIACDFLDEHPKLSPPARYDVIFFQESLSNFPALTPVFQKVKQLLSPTQGRVILSEEVAYHAEHRPHAAVHEAKNIEHHVTQQGFFVTQHQRIGPQVAPTCAQFIQRFEEKQPQLLQCFGEQAQPLIDYYKHYWQQKLSYYQAKQIGYEIWTLRPSDFTVEVYRKGDETHILNTFQTAFGVMRNPIHWQWKFKDSPFGGPYVTTVWDKTELAAHYTAYPVPIWLNNRSHMTYQVGDTFTHPSYRGIGRGATSLLARAVRQFHRLYCENQIPFFYGFNTDKIQKFGRLFLRYYPVAPIYEWFLTNQALHNLSNTSSWQLMRQGYTVNCVEQIGPWADKIFAQAKTHYGWLIERTQQYLQWRYEAHPDYHYYFFVVRHWGKPVGWWLGRVEGDTLIIGDALFSEKNLSAARAGLIGGLGFMKKAHNIQMIRAWFSQTPLWWNQILNTLGFESERQYQNLDLCVTPFEETIEVEKIAQHFYFTHGDSDLF